MKKNTKIVCAYTNGVPKASNDVSPCGLSQVCNETLRSCDPQRALGEIVRACEVCDSGVIKCGTVVEGLTQSARASVDPCQSDTMTSSSCLITIENIVYDVGPYLDIHPGGREIIEEWRDADATGPFFDKPHSKKAIETLYNFRLGRSHVSSSAAVGNKN